MPRRIACLWVPDILLVAHLRLEPALADVPLALTKGDGSRSFIAAVSRRSRSLGIEPGMRLSQARSLCASLVIRRVAESAVASAMAALVDVARTVGPRVESNGRDRVFLDCQGTHTIVGSETSLASVLVARAERCGLVAWVGIADSKLVAYLAAHEGGGVCIVPPGGASEFLAPRSVHVLEPDRATVSKLREWGIRTIGGLLALPPGTVAHRLGVEGSALVRRARGEDADPFVAQQIPPVIEERTELEYGVDRIEPLLFVLHRLLECIATRMAVCGVGCRGIDLVIGFEDGGQDLRMIAAAAPTVDAKTLLLLARANLESRPPAQAVWALRVTGVAERVSPAQLDFFESAGPAPAALAATLARLTALCGADRVGILRPVDSHRPDPVRVDSFVGTVSRPFVEASKEGTSAPVVRLALRAFRPPIHVDVFETPKFLEYVRGPGFGGRVVHWAGPWRIRGDWWTDHSYARAYYDVELSDGGIYRIYRDARSGAWSVDGVYD